MKEFFKERKKEILVIISVLVIILVYNIVKKTRAYIINQEYCESDRRYDQGMYFVDVSKEKQPKYNQEVRLKYNDGLQYYIDVKSNDSYLPDPDNPNRNKQCVDITDSYFYYLNEKNFSLNVELLDKEKFLLKTFTVRNFKLEDNYKSFPDADWENPKKVLISRGIMEMSKETFEWISCWPRKCKDCKNKSEPYKSMNLKIL